jgi:putative glycosyltransferase (TIGR04372 family)
MKLILFIKKLIKAILPPFLFIICKKIYQLIKFCIKKFFSLLRKIIPKKIKKILILLKHPTKTIIKIYSQIYFLSAQNYFSKAVSSLPKDIQLFLISRTAVGEYLILMHYVSCWQKIRGKAAICFVNIDKYKELFDTLRKYICPDAFVIQYKSKIKKYEHLLSFDLYARIFNKIVGIICSQRPNTIQIFKPFNFDPIISEHKPAFDKALEKYKIKYSKDFINAYLKMKYVYDVNFDVMSDSFKLFYENNSFNPPQELKEKLKTLLKNLKITKKYITLNLNTKEYYCDNGNTRRVTSFKKYDALIEFLIKQNYQVVIHGRRNTNPLSLTKKTDQIEYDNSQYCSIENDLALYYGAEFAITNKSGPMLFAIACNIPLLILDYVEWPANHSYKKLRFYPKPIKNKKTNNYLSWKNFLELPGFFNHHIYQYNFENYIYQDMKIEETIEATKEFLSLLKQPNEIWTKHTDLQKKFLNSLNPLHMELYEAQIVPCDTYLKRYY